MDNSNELISPDWMNKDFFTTVIVKHTGDAKATVVDFVIKPSLAIGEHCTYSLIKSLIDTRDFIILDHSVDPSLIFRADINFSTTSKTAQSLSVIVKSPRPGADSALILPLFDVEMDMYNGPLNDIEMLLRSVGDFSNIQPKLIYQTATPTPIIVLEDLGAKGYEKISKPLEDYDVAKIVVLRLAKYHAATFFMMKDKKVDFSRFKNSMFHLDNDLIKQMLDETIDVAVDALASWEGYEGYSVKLRTLKESYSKKGKALCDPDVNGFNVLMHGDFHTKNLMFKKDGDKVVDCYFIDFQIPNVASPCADLFYVLYAIMGDEIRRKYRAEIIHEYHTEFSSMLKRFGYIGLIPSLLDLQIDLLKHGFMEAIQLICFKIFFAVDNINEVFGGDTRKMKEQIFRSPRFRALLEVELPRLVHLGIL